MKTVTSYSLWRRDSHQPIPGQVLQEARPSRGDASKRTWAYVGPDREERIVPICHEGILEVVPVVDIDQQQSLSPHDAALSLAPVVILPGLGSCR